MQSSLDTLPDELRQLTRREALQLIKSLMPKYQRALSRSWRFLARPSQMPPGDPWSDRPDRPNWFIWLIMSGRGFGKTRTGAETVIQWARETPRIHIALVGATADDVRKTMLSEGHEHEDQASGILAVSTDDFRPIYEPSKRLLTWPNGSTATIYTGEEPGRLRGPQHHKAWIDELAAFKYSDQAWDMLQFGLRLGINPQVVITTTPRPIPIIKKLVKRKDCIVTEGSSYDNRANLSEIYYKNVIKPYEGTRLGEQEIYGKLLLDNPGALFKYAFIEPYRVERIDDLYRIVVAIDPAVTSKPESDETSLVVCGIKTNIWKPHGEHVLENARDVDHGYVLEECTGRFTPKQWGEKAVELYDKWKADRIVAEVNNGGDLVEANIRSINSNVSYNGVHASKGKAIRAEPVAALYERGMIHHVGNFKELEDEITEWDPKLNLPSPNRLDALVWGFTDLLLSDEIKAAYGGYKGGGRGRMQSDNDRSWGDF